MGTNFYAREEICKTCGHAKKEIHIGKSSFGWTFSFHASEEMRSAKLWYMFLSQKDVKIFDEYDREISFEDFKNYIDSKKKEKHNHAKEYPEGCFIDQEGNSFSEREFS